MLFSEKRKQIKLSKTTMHYAKRIVEHIKEVQGEVIQMEASREETYKVCELLPDSWLCMPMFVVKADEEKRPTDALDFIVVGTNPAAVWDGWKRFKANNINEPNWLKYIEYMLNFEKQLRDELTRLYGLVLSDN